MQNRRTFIRHFIGAAAVTGGLMSPLLSTGREKGYKLTVLHTNDLHSRIDPFPMNDPKYPGMGGFARRAALIRKIRSQEPNVLLLDAGDIFQGTPYFNLFNGEVEIKLMSEMGYDASAIGNHDFDGGIENLAVRAGEAAFPFLCCNYDFSNTPLYNKAKNYQLFKKAGLTIGVFGLGIELRGLVDPQLSKETTYNDPLASAQRYSRILKHDLHCDLVICLSHLGYKYGDKRISDELIAQYTSGIDLIIGGHTHTFLDEPVRYRNSDGREVLVAQAGWAGLRLGRIDFYFDYAKRKKGAIAVIEKDSNYAIAS